MPVQNLIQLRRGTIAAGPNQWTNQILAAGEVGFETDTGKFKIGDGTTTYDSLPYASVLPSELDELIDARVSNLLVEGNNITLTYDDGANSLTVSAAGTSEADVQDIIGDSVKGGDGITVTYSDASTGGTGETTISLTDPTIQVADITDLTATAGEINVLDGITAGTSELNLLDGATAGSAVAGKVLVVDANKDIDSIRNLTIEGNLIVNGTTTTINSTTLTVDDKLIEIGAVDNPTDLTADGGGISLKGDTDKTILWETTNNGQWTSSEKFNLASGKSYYINNTEVLSATALGAGIVVDGGTP
jgi:hypothetical protein